MQQILSHIIVGFTVLMSHLSLRILYLFSDIIYLILYYIVGYRKKVVMKNLCNSFPEKSNKEHNAIAKEYYKHMADLFVEIIKYGNISKKEINKRCRLVNPEFLKENDIENRSVICVIAHYGNWEWVTHISSEINHTVLAVYKPLHNKTMDGYFKKIREKFGQKTVPMKSVLRTLVAHSNKGDVIAVGLVSDQIPVFTKQAHWMPFLNQDTSVFLGAEKIAKMNNLPILFIKVNKVKRGYYEMRFELVEENPRNTPKFEITERYTHMIEQMIKDAPPYWMWSHNRWKRKRDEE